MNKKALFALSLVFLLVSCESNSSSFRKLNEVKYPSEERKFEFIDYSQVNPITSFAYNSSKEILNTNKNSLYSPLSFYYALSMLAEGISNDDTLVAINNLLNNSSETRKEVLGKIYRNNYFKNENGENKIANSFWFRNGLDVNTNFVNTLGNDYYAEIFETDFTKVENKKRIIDWLNDKTNDLLNLTLDNYQIDDDLSSVLFNTIYFKNNWSEAFNENLTNKQDFTLLDGTILKKDFMHKSYDTLFYKEDSFSACKDTFYNGYSIEYVLPNDSYSIDDVLANKDIYNLINGEYCQIHLSLPKFKENCSFDLDEYTKSVGLSSLYSPGNLENIAPTTYVSKIKQDTGISLDEDGVEAAAITSIWMKETAFEPVEKEVDFILNKPFVYIIYAAGNVPMFVGVETNPEV